MVHYTIYFEQKKLIIADEATFNFNGHNTLYSEYDNVSLLEALIQSLISLPSVETLYVYSQQAEEVWEAFQSLYTIVEAAGGLVLNKASHALLIHRYGMWDLPKGKKENNETLEEAAVREVIEECGVKDLVVESSLGKTYHTYILDQKKILKVSHWYLMRCHDNEPDLIPQTIEGITDARWMSVNDVIQNLNQTFASVRGVLTQNFIKSL